MRHEAEAFFGRYGDVHGNLAGSIRSADGFNPEDEGSSRVRGSIEDDQGELVRSGDGISRSLAAHILSPLKRWFERSRQFVRELIFAGALAMAGPDDLSAADTEILNRSAQVQVDYLDKFEREIISNPPPEIGDADLSQVILVEPPRSVGQRIAQAESYGNAVWQATINTGREKVRKQNVFEKERRVHLLAEHEHKYCKTCIDQSRKGWKPLGTLNEIGDSECMGSCDCYFEWMAPDGKIYVSPWGRHNPKGYNQPGAHGTQLPGIAYPPDQPTPAAPPAKVEIIQPAPTTEEIDAEVKKWIAGKPSRLTVKSVKERPAYNENPELPEGYEVLGD
jgi:hypothetical protein